jgi:hypothetical protein
MGKIATITPNGIPRLASYCRIGNLRKATLDAIVIVHQLHFLMHPISNGRSLDRPLTMTLIL